MSRKFLNDTAMDAVARHSKPSAKTILAKDRKFVADLVRHPHLWARFPTKYTSRNSVTCTANLIRHRRRAAFRDSPAPGRFLTQTVFTGDAYELWVSYQPSEKEQSE